QLFAGAFSSSQFCKSSQQHQQRDPYQTCGNHRVEEWLAKTEHPRHGGHPSASQQTHTAHAQPLLAFLLALLFALDEVAAVAVLLCGCCPGGNLSNLMTLLVDGDMNLSIIMTASSIVLALFLMPLCLWIYSRAWINTPFVRLLPLGAVTLTLCSTLLPIGLGVFIRYKYTRLADILVKECHANYGALIRDKNLNCARGDSEEDTDVSYKKLKEEAIPEISYGTVMAEDRRGPVVMEPTQMVL
ncbi:sodium/bile acid cotransporter 4-like, partial [Protobothrops mucrosquamatus]|uniref:sodium/bile acid cotransporter 4-like n=1 Tax=Protobothrops mucrosquamatus TaxID=103944 RepID=UPI000775700F